VVTHNSIVIGRPSYAGSPKFGLLLKKQAPYIDRKKKQRVGALWKIAGWDSRVLESFLKRMIHENAIQHFPVRHK